MKKTYFLTYVFLGLLFARCTYESQLITLQSSNLVAKPEGLILENDTLLLTYDFYSPQGKIKFTIYNKLTIPLYIDWKKSAYITGKIKNDYWTDQTRLTSNGETFPSVLYPAQQYINIDGTLRREDRITFIPPQTEISQSQFLALPGEHLPKKGSPQVLQEKKTWRPGKKPTTIKRYLFQPETSPLAFRNYLTLSTQENFESQFHIDTHFWVSEIQEMDHKQLRGVASRNPKSSLLEYQHPYQSPQHFYVTY